MKEETLTRALHRYERAPHLVFWETTKACGLACQHCRASAQLDALPGELDLDEGKSLIDQIVEMGSPSPILVFTGGDCLARPDLNELISYASSKKLRLGIAPSVTDRLTREALEEIFALGVRSISISLDGSTEGSHDSLRGIPGHFDQTIAALEMMRDIGYRVQVNTTVMQHNVTELADVHSLLRKCGVPIWEVFFLVGVGRGAAIDEVSAQQAEDVCHFLVDVAATGMVVRTVEAPFFRRVQAERALHPGVDPHSVFTLGPLYELLSAGLPASDARVHRASNTLATGDGRGVIFVGYDGEMHASGFLPVPLGNVRTESLGDIYTENALLRALRAGALEGDCGRCAFSRLCGGSRARAFARTGRALGDDPCCVNVRPRLTLLQS